MYRMSISKLMFNHEGKDLVENKKKTGAPIKRTLNQRAPPNYGYQQRSALAPPSPFGMATARQSFFLLNVGQFVSNRSRSKSDIRSGENYTCIPSLMVDCPSSELALRLSLPPVKSGLVMVKINDICKVILATKERGASTDVFTLHPRIGDLLRLPFPGTPSQDTFGPFPLHCLSQLNSRGTGRNIKI
ncbi:hypothetical protein TIFTF001_043475 [Ficus carica]|uniref:Uncharacterized protein n=1 Tax=Ficus carica TaxID=3494 RepID=A0AA87ZA15_FICCA|nr:hypothetical protein TIFTF001_043475 [Ficus carica]